VRVLTARLRLPREHFAFNFPHVSVLWMRQRNSYNRMQMLFSSE
jgi:hypothetical protein